jgi:3-oxoacyl-ACP reductase-like protein
MDPTTAPPAPTANQLGPPPAPVAPAAPAAAPAAPAPAPEPQTNSTEPIEWLGIVLIGLAMTSMVFKMFVYKKQLAQMESEDKKMNTVINELKYNLQKSLGNKYESMA